jgi:peroxiredoxin
MKKILHPLFAILALSLFASSIHAKPAQPEGFQELKIGDAAPDFSLPGIDGKTYRLADFKEAKLLMVAFISNHCPASHAAEPRLKQLVTDMKEKGLQVVAINPNSPEALRADELGYSKYNDSFEDMVKYAAEQQFNFPYLDDGSTQVTAKAYGCLATPHVFLFDADRKLRYKGYFDDSRFIDPATVRAPDTRNAVEALLAGKEVPVTITKPHGCSTKWLEKKAEVVEKKAQLDSTPVEVELIDAAAVAALRKNGDANLRLFNVWSTTCAPCVKEFPELVATARKFGMRNFEFISLSTDDPADLPKVKNFLEKQGAAPAGQAAAALPKQGRKTNSYLYTGADVNEMMKALDPEWPGGMPHTVLVAQDGSVLWRHNGLVDGGELREKILSILGTTYPQP